MKDRFQIMFALRMPIETSLLCLVGIDYDNGCMFSCTLYSPNDKVQLDYNTSHYPNPLLNYLKSQEVLINEGYYDLRTWQITLFDETVRERKSFMANKDRGIIKWNAFKSLPEQWSGLNKMFEEDKKVAKPTLDENALEEINTFLLESLENDLPLLFKLYEKGFIKVMGPGIVSKVDTIQRIIQITDKNGEFKNIPFMKIVGVEAI